MTSTLERIYHHPTKRYLDIPQLDLLTLLFESEHSVAASQSSTTLHIDATNPSNNLTTSTLLHVLQRIAYILRHDFSVGTHNAPHPDPRDKDIVTVITSGQILVPALLFGIIAAGGVYSAASPSSTVGDLSRQIRIAKSKIVVCGVSEIDVACAAAGECGTRVLVLSSEGGKWGLTSVEKWREGHAANLMGWGGGLLKWRKIEGELELKNSLIVILWSSGTTGLPKGVMLSHTNLVAETFLTALSGREWAAAEMEKGTYAGKELTTLAHLPVSHIAGLFGYLIAPMYSGGTVYWMRKYEWKALLENLRRFKITSFYTVPSIWLRISKARELEGGEFKALEAASTGAAPMDSALQKSANRRLGDGRNVFVGQTWGLSETTGAVTAPVKDMPDNTGSIGYILPTVELRLVDEDYKDVEEGSEGEFLVKSPLVTNGYFDNPQATTATFHGGWFCTGDIGVVRGGKLYVVDRKKELLKYKGLQVAPAELENVLFTHSQVKEAAVVGVPAPDDPGTDLPRAYVVPVHKSTVTAEEIQVYVKARVAPYKQLRGGVAFIEEIPKNAIGKFLRRELRERAKRELRTSKL